MTPFLRFLFIFSLIRFFFYLPLFCICAPYGVQIVAAFTTLRMSAYVTGFR